MLLLAILGFLALRNARDGQAEAAEETPAAENTPSDSVAGPTDAGPTRAPTDTPTVELPTEPAGGSSMVTVLSPGPGPVSYTPLRAHETVIDLVCRLLLDKKIHHQTTCAPATMSYMSGHKVA